MMRLFRLTAIASVLLSAWSASGAGPETLVLLEDDRWRIGSRIERRRLLRHASRRRLQPLR